MDRSVDSIGSCSLDVDADSTDFSDTSGSLNITPLSAKDITKEFTANFRERCKLSPSNNFQQTTTYLDKSGNITTVITPPIPVIVTEKKPSYLNLACCVNGYSNLTTYDSKLRQNINKSREVSPIRPSANTLQYCKNFKNLLTPPFLMFSNESSPTAMETRQISQKTSTIISTTQGAKIPSILNSTGDYDTTDKASKIESPKSFIQQRVERLYGASAIQKGFYSPKKTIIKTSPTTEKPNYIKNNISEIHNENDSNNKLNGFSGNISDLPVLRHLRPEFRAQLPIVSPKKMKSEISIAESKTSSKETAAPITNNTNELDSLTKNHDGKDLEFDNMSKTIKTVVNCEEIKEIISNSDNNFNEEEVIDSHYFLDLLKTEQNRLLDLASKTEKYMDSLTDNPEISDEVLGYLRSASGKARLLVTQKMKQFEGLCHKNLVQKADEKFLTTVEDLQGFWDMVKLQIDHVDILFNEIETLRENDWKNSDDLVSKSSSTIVSSNSSRRYSSLPKTTTNKSSDLNGAPKYKTGISSKKASTAAANQKRENQRKQLMELIRKNKLALATGKQENQENILFINENSS